MKIYQTFFIKKGITVWFLSREQINGPKLSDEKPASIRSMAGYHTFWSTKVCLILFTQTLKKHMLIKKPVWSVVQVNIYHHLVYSGAAEQWHFGRLGSFSLNSQHSDWLLSFSNPHKKSSDSIYSWFACFCCHGETCRMPDSCPFDWLIPSWNYSHQVQDAPDVLTGHICTDGINGTIRVLDGEVRISIFLLN